MPAEIDKRNGKWRYRKWVTLPDGKRKRLKGTPGVNTKKAAEHAERLAIERAMNPQDERAVEAVAPREEVVTLREYSDAFLEGYAADNKPSEKAGKKRILKRYIWPALGDMPLDTIDQSHVDMFRAELLRGKTRSGTRSRRTVNNIIAVLSTLLRYAATNRMRRAVSDMKFIMKEDQTELVALRPDQVVSLVGATTDLRYRAAVLLGADAGLRVGEIRGLEWDCVDELRRRIIVARAIDPANNVGAPKNRKRRTVPATPRLWEALAALPRVGRAVIGRRDNGNPLGYWTMRDELLDVYGEAGVPVPPKPWHCLRHTFCTELATAGVPVHVIKRLAGHASIETTLKYMHSTEHDMDRAVEALAGTFGPQAGHKDEQEGE